MLVHHGSAFGTQNAAFWVLRDGSPICSAAVRGDNFSIRNNNPGIIKAGVMGMTTAGAENVGVLGAASGPSNLVFGEIGVMGVTASTGVAGKSLAGFILEDQNTLIAGAGVVGDCDAGVGVHGVSKSGWGVFGQSTGRAGVTGRSVSGVGVEARSDQSHGLQATANGGVGVLAESVGNRGVLGISRDGVGVNGYSDQGLAGVHGQSPRRIGVMGESDQGVGIYGSAAGNAIQGWSTGSGGASIGVVGWSNAGDGIHGESDRGTGVFGRSANGWAAAFEGNVLVKGSFYVVGGAKSAAVLHPDGTHRTLFCVESPESYFEDFGEVTLTGASVTVELDKDFAALVRRNKYQVFLTSYGPEALYVSRREPGKFVITRVESGTGARLRRVQVGYRIVARRADVKSGRLPKIKLPAQAAEMVQPAATPGMPRRKGARGIPRVGELERLPDRPLVPSIDIDTIAKAKPAAARGKRSKRAGENS
jgi:hypothetical protein